MNLNLSWAWAQLNEAELSIAELLIKGYHQREIAEKLDRPLTRVKQQLKRMERKFNIQSVHKGRMLQLAILLFQTRPL